jgi:CO/xanthine dehydrogenase FAD-binding subunit
MKPPPFEYARPETLADAVALLASSNGEAKLLAGGQSLVPLLNLRRIRPALLIDLVLVPDLKVLARAREELVIGAGVRQREVETSALVRETCALLPLALRHVGHVQTRHRGTIGGSLAHADPAAELPAVALAVDAKLVAVGPNGRRVIAADEFFNAPYDTALERDEVLTELRVPIRTDARYAFLEIARPTVVAVAAAATPTETRLAASGIGPVPTVLSATPDTALLRTLVSRALAEIAA